MRKRGRRKKASRGRSTTPPPPRAHGDRLKSVLVCIFLVAIVWVAFVQMLGHEFINYDDNQYVTDNVHVLNGLNWPDVKWAFTTGHPGYAHPVTWLTHQLDCQLYDDWAGGHHLTSLVIHTINSLLVFWLFWRMTRDLWPSAFVAALFAIHPLHVESIAWVAERKDVLSGLFFLLTLHAYVAYAAKPHTWRYLLALGLFVLGILSKPMLVTVPCLLLLLDYWPLRRLTFPARKGDPASRFSLGSLILEKVPFALIAASWSLLTFVLQKKFGIVAEKADIGIAFRIANAVVSYAMYMWNTFWPHDLTVFYPYPGTVLPGAVILSGAVLVLISALCLATRRSSPSLIIGWFWYLGMLVPVIGLVQVGDQARADRYMYLPQIGLCLMITWGAMELFAKWRRSREVLAVTALFIIIGLTALSYVQTSYWRNSETLWNQALTNTSDNYIAHNNLGNILMKIGRLDEAVDHFRKTIEIYAGCAEAHTNLGDALASRGRWADAIASYQAAIQVRPNYPNAHNNLGISLAEAGQTDEALAQFREALRIDGDHRDAHCNLAILLLKLGQREEAVAHLREALRLKPDDEKVSSQLRQLGVER